MIPLYVYPGSAWTAIIQAKQANPSVPVIAIINPNSGPGSASDPAYVSGIQQLQAAGIMVLGYDHTSYGARSVTDVEADAAHYNSWYHVNGLFFDEMAATTGYEGYYSTINAYAKSLGMTYTVGNPGTTLPSSYMGILNNLVIYEDSGLTATSSLPSSYPGSSAGEFSVISYADPEPTTAQVQGIAANVGYVYFTDANLPNPYGALPSYLAAEVSMLASPSTPSTTTATTTSNPPVTTTTSNPPSTTTTTVTQVQYTTVTSTATAYATTTATAQATVTSTHTANTTTTSTQTLTANATTTDTTTETATAVTTGTQTVNSTLTDTATTTQTETETATTTTTMTLTAQAPVAPPALAAPAFFSGVVMNSTSPIAKPTPAPSAIASIRNAVVDAAQAVRAAFADVLQHLGHALQLLTSVF